MSRIIGIGIGLGFTYGGAGGSVINPTLAAPTLVWDGESTDLLPDFTIAYEAQVADIVTLRRSTAADFGTYEEVSDTVDSIDPANTLEFDFGGNWSEVPYATKAYYTRSGVVSSLSSTSIVNLDSSLYWNCDIADVGYVENDDTCDI